MTIENGLNMKEFIFLVCVFSSSESFLAFSRAIIQTPVNPGLVRRLAQIVL
jgi:hypothetical protein